MGLFKGIVNSVGRATGLKSTKSEDMQAQLAENPYLKKLLDTPITGVDIAGKAAQDAAALQFGLAGDQARKTYASQLQDARASAELMGADAGGLERANMQSSQLAAQGIQGLAGQQAAELSGIGAQNIGQQVDTRNKGIFALSDLAKFNAGQLQNTMAGNIAGRSLAEQATDKARMNTLASGAQFLAGGGIGKIRGMFAPQGVA